MFHILVFVLGVLYFERVASITQMVKLSTIKESNESGDYSL